MSNRKIYFWGSVVSLAIGIAGSIQLYDELVTKYYGKRVEAKVVEVSLFCHRRNNRVEVELAQNHYSVLISGRECKENKYQVDKVYSFIYHSGLDYMITTKRGPEVVVPFMLLIFIISIYGFRKSIKK